MIQITDKLDGKKKLRRSYEDYLPLETSEPQETQTTETPEPAGETTEPAGETTEPTAEPTSEPNEA